MVTRYALIRDGIVENVTLWDGDCDTWQPPEDCEAVRLNGQTVSPGDLYDGQTFTPGESLATTATVTVEIDPTTLADVLAQAQKATTVATTKAALTALIEHLTPSE